MHRKVPLDRLREATPPLLPPAMEVSGKEGVRVALQGLSAKRLVDHLQVVRVPGPQGAARYRYLVKRFGQVDEHSALAR